MRIVGQTQEIHPEILNEIEIMFQVLRETADPFTSISW